MTDAFGNDDHKKCPYPENERLFQFWLTELRQRESSNSAVVAITASASLIMLVFFVDLLDQTINSGFMITIKWIVGGSGLTFSILGKKKVQS